MNNFFTREFYFTNEINRKRNLKIHNVQLVAKKNGNCQNKIDTFLQFFNSVKPSYEREVRINVKIQ
jgi:hypothetical protein